ncbi:FAD-dependent oxidoreductase [Actinoplanes sp. CA-030573]|uniref:FAD-dependent oxidoreductase n=1 Tax=Actinoplanes sp. CA-030573 TaxID=3239898 RepID=UPI003D8ED3BB
MPEATVIGAGVGGLAAALALQQRGWEVRLFERAAALENAGAGLAVQPNALRVLARLGVAGRLREMAALQGAAGIRKPSCRSATAASTAMPPLRRRPAVPRRTRRRCCCGCSAAGTRGSPGRPAGRPGRPGATALRDAAMSLAGRLGPGLVLKQTDPVLRWEPPDH